MFTTAQWCSSFGAQNSLERTHIISGWLLPEVKNSSFNCILITVPEFYRLERYNNGNPIKRLNHRTQIARRFNILTVQQGLLYGAVR